MRLRTRRHARRSRRRSAVRRQGDEDDRASLGGRGRKRHHAVDVGVRLPDAARPPAGVVAGFGQLEHRQPCTPSSTSARASDASPARAARPDGERGPSTRLAASRRRPISRLSATASDGSSATSPSRSARRSCHSSASLMARTVAARGRSSRIPSSPTTLPGPSDASTRLRPGLGDLEPAPLHEEERVARVAGGEDHWSRGVCHRTQARAGPLDGRRAGGHGGTGSPAAGPRAPAATSPLAVPGRGAYVDVVRFRRMGGRYPGAEDLGGYSSI